MKSKADMFFDIFVDEFVEILQDYEVTTNVALSENGEVQPLRMPMTITGYVKETDDYFLFMSKDGKEINQALPIESIKHIAIVDQSDTIMDILDEANPPEDQGFN